MSWEALRYGVHTTYSEDHPDYLVYNPSGGLGFLDGFIIDAHFRYDILTILFKMTHFKIFNLWWRCFLAVNEVGKDD